jgi:hypothetical protein
MGSTDPTAFSERGWGWTTTWATVTGTGGGGPDFLPEQAARAKSVPRARIQAILVCRSGAPGSEPGADLAAMGGFPQVEFS